ncbi:MAG: hypothetical protein BWY92_01707 [Firmicutes bacterium ADurb.BinA052]|nr:MAG: hypothetical protein BWY92_01707 [Firmicutes bacterium ADurb.BinA052]
MSCLGFHVHGGVWFLVGLTVAGIPGTGGGVVSINTMSKDFSSPTLPRLSTPYTLRMCSPSGKSEAGVYDVPRVVIGGSPSSVTT